MTTPGLHDLSGVHQVPDRIAALKGEPLVIHALAYGATIAQAADAGNVTERTVYTRLANVDGYRDLRDTIRREATADALAKLSGYARLFAAELARIATTSKSDATRVRAADRGLTHLLRLAEHVDTSRRLDALEAELAAINARTDRGRLTVVGGGRR